MLTLEISVAQILHLLFCNLLKLYDYPRLYLIAAGCRLLTLIDDDDRRSQSNNEIMMLRGIFYKLRHLARRD